MKFATSVWAGVAVLAMAQAAEAAPKVQGKYAVMAFEQCASAFTFTTDTYLKPGSVTGPAVKGINSTQNGEFGIEVGTFTFPASPSSAGNASIALTNVNGDVLRINGGGSAVAVQTVSLAGTFSVAATTLTFTPTGQPAITWTASYGDINTANNTARTIYLVRKETNWCIQGITATKQ